MLLWLNGTDNTRWDAERELRARAAGAVLPRRGQRLQRARRARAGPRADRLRQRLGATPGRAASASTRSSTTRARRGSTAGAATSAGRTACGSSRAIGATPSSSSTKLWGYFIPTTPPPRPRRALEALYVASDREVRPLLEAILAPPRPLRRGQADGQAAGRAGRGHAARASGRGIDTAAWAWLCERAGQYLFLPPNVAGWDDTRWLDTATFRARWQMAAAHLRPPGGADPTSDTGSVPTDPQSSSTTRSASGAPPRSRPETRGGLDALRRRQALGDAGARWEKRAYPVLALNALRHARRHVPRLPDELSDGPLLHRLRPRRPAPPGSPKRAEASPRSSPACRARRHRPVPPLASCCAAPGSGSPSTAPAASLLPRASRTGSPPPQAAGPQRGARSRLPRRRRRLALAARPGRRPALPQAAAEAGARRVGGRRVHRGRAAALAPVASRRSPTCTARARSPCCPRSATPTRTSRTSPRATSGRSARSTRTCARAGSGACSTVSARPTTRSRALARRRSSRRRWRPPATRSRRSTSPRTSASGRRGAWGAVEDAGVPRVHRASARSLSGRATPRSRRPRGAAGVRRRRARRARAARRRTASPAYTPAAAYPQSDDAFPRRLAGLRGDARRRAADPRRRAQRSRDATTRTPTRPQALPKNLQLTFDSLLAFQRDLEARGLADRVLVARLVGVRPPRGGERLAAPTTAPPASAS